VTRFIPNPGLERQLEKALKPKFDAMTRQINTAIESHPSESIEELTNRIAAIMRQFNVTPKVTDIHQRINRARSEGGTSAT
jgi:hypothetical protein